MPAVTRQGDTCTGHGAFPPRANDQGSPDVFINGLPAHRQGDHWVAHCDPSPSCHDSSAQTGSASVFVNGKALMRIGDPIACGSAIAQGSPNVLAGD